MTPYGYTSRRHEDETGLMYFRARYYDTATGEFLSRDPLGYIDGMSLYRGYFVPGGVDPLGLLQENLRAVFGYQEEPKLHNGDWAYLWGGALSNVKSGSVFYQDNRWSYVFSDSKDNVLLWVTRQIIDTSPLVGAKDGKYLVTDTRRAKTDKRKLGDHLPNCTKYLNIGVQYVSVADSFKAISVFNEGKGPHGLVLDPSGYQGEEGMVVDNLTIQRGQETEKSHNGKWAHATISGNSTPLLRIDSEIEYIKKKGKWVLQSKSLKWTDVSSDKVQVKFLEKMDR